MLDIELQTKINLMFDEYFSMVLLSGLSISAQRISFIDYNNLKSMFGLQLVGKINLFGTGNIFNKS